MGISRCSYDTLSFALWLGGSCPLHFVNPKRRKREFTIWSAAGRCPQTKYEKAWKKKEKKGRPKQHGHSALLSLSIIRIARCLWYLCLRFANLWLGRIRNIPTLPPHPRKKGSWRKVTLYSHKSNSWSGRMVDGLHGDSLHLDSCSMDSYGQLLDVFFFFESVSFSRSHGV